MRPRQVSAPRKTHREKNGKGENFASLRRFAGRRLESLVLLFRQKCSSRNSANVVANFGSHELEAEYPK
eukprot:6197958-Pleurochrysis_carterae.AAC.2